jgi:transposase-like protein
VISDAHEGLKAAIRRVLGAAWQRCRVHWVRNVLAYVPTGQRTMVAAALRQDLLRDDAANAHRVWRAAADQTRQRRPRLGTLMDESEHDVLAYMAFPVQHRTKPHSTNPLERLNKGVKRGSPRFLVQQLSGSGRLQDPSPQQVMLGSPIHLPLDQLELGDLTFGLPVAPG